MKVKCWNCWAGKRNRWASKDGFWVRSKSYASMQLQLQAEPHYYILLHYYHLLPLPRPYDPRNNVRLDA